MKQIKKIYVIGPEGSGKSTLAKIISKKLKIKPYDLDDVVWSKRYDKKRTHEMRLKKLKEIINKKSWVIEGIFGGWTEPAFKSSDLVVMLNLDYYLLVKNLLKRSFVGRFNEFEKEKTKLKDTFKVIKHVKKYRIRDHPKSYIGHKKLIDKFKCEFIEIKNKRQLNNFIENLN